MMMMEQIRDVQEDGEDDEEDFMKKDGSSNNKGSSGNQKANMPRSKHSETEQRRRSKINERFQILRDLLPPSDQKRDKASFLLEVIEYVQFLHERLHKYENQRGGKQELSKLAPWRYSYWTSEGMVENSRLKNGPGKANDSNVSIMPTMPLIHNPVVDSDLKDIPPTTPLQPNIYTPLGINDGIVRPISDEDNISPQPSALWQQTPQPWNTDCQTSETLNEQEEIVVEGGTINIASVYSQGLLNNLTQALQSSGVDLSQASISVQIDLGKRAIGRLATTPTSSSKDPGDPSTTNRGQTHSRDGSSGEDTNEGRKRHKT